MGAYNRYAEDLTGTNPDNRVAGELCSLSDRPVRVAVPKHGPFFVESLIVYDNLTQRQLTKNTDYRVPMIVREATLRTGKEIGDAILIENPLVASQIVLFYQTIGGEYQNNIDNLVNIYESFLNDGRTVDWTTGIYGKPTEFPPALHPHWLSEIYGFEPVTVELERIAQAILLGNTPAFEALLQAMETKGASLQEMSIGQPLKKYVTLEGLLSVLDKYNFNSMVLTPATMLMKIGQGIWFDLKASFVPDNVQYFWSIEHETTAVESFVAQTGYVNLSSGQGQFMIQSTTTAGGDEPEYFRVAVRRGSGTGQIVATSRRMTLAASKQPLPGSILDALSTCCLKSPLIQRSAKTTEIVRKRKNATYS